MPFPQEDVKKLIEAGIPNAEVFVQDLTGTLDHYKVVVVSDAFDGKSLVQRHQMVNEALKEPLKGPIHTLTMETYTTAQWQERGQKAGSSGVQQQPMGIKL